MTLRPRHQRHPRRGEEAFTLIELLIVVIIIAIAVFGLIHALTSARVTARNEAMKAAASTVDQALGAFNRIYEPTPEEPDQFYARGGGMVWTGNNVARTSGLADETNAWILEEWPDNPYASGGVRVVRHATEAGCNATGAPGEIHACRTAPLGAMTYRVRAWGRNKNGAAIAVYDQRHGGR